MLDCDLTHKVAALATLCFQYANFENGTPQKIQANKEEIVTNFG